MEDARRGASGVDGMAANGSNALNGSKGGDVTGVARNLLSSKGVDVTTQRALTRVLRGSVRAHFATIYRAKVIRQYKTVRVGI